MFELAPSILSADFACLGEQIHRVEEAGVKWLHIDVMDGAFVPSISYGMPVIASIRKETALFFDVHLMVEEPGRYIQAFKECGADQLTIHAEACRHLDGTLRDIKAAGMKAGIALNPGTSLHELDHVLNLVDMVLVMTVNPGFGGQSYITNCTEKIRKLRKMIDETGLAIDLQVDGGINRDTIQTVLDAGANIIVAGSAVFSGDIGENVRQLKGIMEAHEGK
ncbi:MAG: ribulose-phosphate 3-epimerase [Clostridia bacterium]|nr:ribulose-phosphate 3-epimerase [Clostridia bacterium]NCC42250.1 ribulose-phosphate 3-epimerase [Clostridia bacterium]